MVKDETLTIINYTREHLPSNAVVFVRTVWLSINLKGVDNFLCRHSIKLLDQNKFDTRFETRFELKDNHCDI